MNGDIKNQLAKALVENSESPKSNLMPKGEILIPEYNSKAKDIFILGHTENIPPDKSVWVVMDIPQISLCFPRLPIGSNIHFNTKIKGAATPGKFFLSLYAVKQELHQQFIQRHKKKEKDGIPMLQGSLLLSSIELFRD